MWTKRLFEPNLFLTAQLYPLKDWDGGRKIWWFGAWELPGLFVGSNLFNGVAEAGSPGGSFFSEFVTGVVWQPFPISPNISFDFGGNFQAHRKGGKPFLALDYRL
jgi:hypothetical protein